MYLSIPAMAEVGLELTITEDAITIQGNNHLKSRTVRNLQQACKDEGLSPQDGDEVVEHFADLTVWRALKRIAD